MKAHTPKVKMPRAARISHPGVPALEWLSDVSGRTVRATAIGNRQVLIENHTGILDFTDEQIRLSTASGPLCVQGHSLTLCEVRENALIVHGCIRSLELPGEGGGQ